MVPMPKVGTRRSPNRVPGIDPHSGEVQNFVMVHSDNGKRASQEGEPAVL